MWDAIIESIKEDLALVILCTLISSWIIYIAIVFSIRLEKEHRQCKMLINRIEECESSFSLDVVLTDITNFLEQAKSPTHMVLRWSKELKRRVIERQEILMINEINP